MGRRLQINPQRLTPEQLGEQNRPDLFLDQLNEDLLAQQQLKQVTAVPGTPKDTEPTYELPEQSISPEPQPVLEKSALETPQPKPSVEPGKTEAVKAAEQQVEKQPDETDRLIGEYRKKRGEIESEQAALEQETQVGERSRQMQTGIAGALQSFGEGLAAITGGSAKPLQTGVAALKSVGEQQAAAQERKGKTLKERLQMAKAPIEEKETEVSLRSRLSKAKMEQTLLDPTSEQSTQARKDATAFIDNMITQGQANKAAPEVLQRLEQSKALIGQMSAAQVQQFYNTLKPLSTETSVEAKNKYELQKLAAQENMRLKIAEAKDFKDQQKLADKDFFKVRSKIAEEESAASKVGPQMEKFLADVKLAVAGDKAAAKRVSQNYGVVNYMNARNYESKGVFTDNDLRALSQLDAGKTWFQQLDDFVSKGMTGQIPKESLMRVQGVLEDNIGKFREPGKYIRTNYAQTFREVQNPAYNKYADILEAPVKGKAEQPSPETQAGPKMIRVRLKSTKQTGTVPESEFDPNIYERI